jgi:hypothetical protein
VSFTQSLVEAFYQTENKHGNMSHNNNKNKIKTTQYKKSLQCENPGKRKKAKY